MINKIKGIASKKAVVKAVVASAVIVAAGLAVRKAMKKDGLEVYEFEKGEEPEEESEE